jgi:hypothetical protein
LVCNALSFTFIFLLNEWQESHVVKDTGFVELKGDKLVFKMQLSLPYQSEWKNELIDATMRFLKVNSSNLTSKFIMAIPYTLITKDLI